MDPKRIFFAGWSAEHQFRKIFAKYNNLYIIKTESPQNADYLVLGVPIDKMMNFAIENSNKISIFVTGEAIVPDFNIFDYAIGYDPIEYNDRYFQASAQVFAYMDQLIEHEPEITDKSKFCNFIYSDGNAHSHRDLIFNTIMNYKYVNSLGKHLNNTEFQSKRNDKDWLLQSIEAKKEYKFSIAFENALHRGYTTEKIFTSFMAGTIPIYWGNPDVNQIFNSKAFINCHEYDSFDDVVERIREIDNDEYLYNDIINQPPLNSKNIENWNNSKKEMIQFIDNIFYSNYEDAFRKANGPWVRKYRNYIFKNERVKKNKLKKSVRDILSLISKHI